MFHVKQCEKHRIMFHVKQSAPLILSVFWLTIIKNHAQGVVISNFLFVCHQKIEQRVQLFLVIILKYDLAAL